MTFAELLLKELGSNCEVRVEKRERRVGMEGGWECEGGKDGQECLAARNRKKVEVCAINHLSRINLV